MISCTCGVSFVPILKSRETQKNRKRFAFLTIIKVVTMTSTEEKKKVGTITMSEEQIKYMKRAFARFDKDGDGTISLRELRTVIDESKPRGESISDDDLTKLWDSSDKNNDDKIDFQEFLNMQMGLIRESETDDDRLHAFRTFDKDDSGYITLGEIRTVLREQGVDEASLESEARAMLRAADEDDDGRIDYREFIKIWSQS